MRREDKAQKRHRAEEHSSVAHTEKEAFPHPALLFRPVVKGAHRLVALPETDQRAGDEHGDAGGDAHPGDGRVPVDASRPIQKHRRNCRQSLPEQSGDAAVHDLRQEVSVQPHVLHIEADIGALHAAEEQHEEADHLAADGGQCGACHTHAEYKDQQRIQKNIQDGAA